jgi:hypothetical protein
MFRSKICPAIPSGEEIDRERLGLLPRVVYRSPTFVGRSTPDENASKPPESGGDETDDFLSGVSLGFAHWEILRAGFSIMGLAAKTRSPFNQNSK